MCVVVTFDISTLVIVDFIYYRRFCFTCRQHSFIVLVECGKKGQSEEQETFFSTKIRTFRPRKIRQALTDDPAGPYLQQMFCFLAEILGQIRLLYTFISAIWNLPALRPLAEL